jgi:hypothetical protein
MAGSTRSVPCDPVYSKFKMKLHVLVSGGVGFVSKVHESFLSGSDKSQIFFSESKQMRL